MDELQQLAKAYYRAGSPELKNEAQELFNSLDNDGDGRVDKNEFVSFMTEQGYRYMNTQKFFNELDTDGNHTLDFWEVMTLLYIFKSRRPFCDGCGRFIPATYFTCLQCPDYDLCISCYENGKSGHNHQFMDNYALLAVKKRADMNEEEETEDVNIDRMDHLRQIAEAYYEASESEIQSKVQDFFKTLDSDKNGRINKTEFISFMREEGHHRMSNPRFFSLIDTDRDGSLDFSEVLTLLYIVRSGRPFCDCCGSFIPTTFFTCAHCHAVNLCISCYRNRRYSHDHPGQRARFLDNYAQLLDAKKSSGGCMNTNHNTSTRPTPTTHESHNRDIRTVPGAKYERWKIALQALQIALMTLGDSCTIM
nr:Ca2+ sensor (EF-Hand superfamily) [Ipomoea batatas]